MVELLTNEQAMENLIGLVIVVGVVIYGVIRAFKESDD